MKSRFNFKAILALVAAVVVVGLLVFGVISLARDAKPKETAKQPGDNSQTTQTQNQPSQPSNGSTAPTAPAPATPPSTAPSNTQSGSTNTSPSTSSSAPGSGSATAGTGTSATSGDDTQLSKSGPADVFALFAVTTLAGAIVARMFLQRTES
jgi:cytoskeletal protein RodZ